MSSDMAILSDGQVLARLVEAVQRWAPAASGLCIDPMADSWREDILECKRELLRRLANKSSVERSPPPGASTAQAYRALERLWNESDLYEDIIHMVENPLIRETLLDDETPQLEVGRLIAEALGGPVEPS